VANCESGAITEGETQSHIDVAICIECGTCMRNCPFDAIIYQTEDEAQAALSARGAGLPPSAQRLAQAGESDP
jgi:Fe-S-cluster-containing hydrogenase component 2